MEGLDVERFTRELLEEMHYSAKNLTREYYPIFYENINDNVTLI